MTRFRLPHLAIVALVVLSGCAGPGDGQRQQAGPVAQRATYGSDGHRLSRFCKVSYKTRDGWSPEVQVEV